MQHHNLHTSAPLAPRPLFGLLALGILAAAGCQESLEPTSMTASEPQRATSFAARMFEAPVTIPVQGSAIHYFSTAVEHSVEPTETGQIVRSTDVIRLSGDIEGFALYHPTTVIDGRAGTLVNTGTQIFSGTIGGSDPVILHDNRFRFEVDLQTGATRGQVFLGRSEDAPHRGFWIECELTVVGTGMTPEGDGLADYSGTCREMGRRSVRPGA